MRLARFNTQVGIADKRYFQGLPSPAAAALLAGFVWMIETNHIETGLESLAVLLLTLVAGLMMVSNIRFSSFKELNLKDKVPFVTLLVVVLVFVVITLKPAMILFILFFGYTLSGPIMTLKQLQQKRALRRQAKSQAKPEKSPATEPQNETPTEETSKE